MTWASDPASTDLSCPDPRIRFAARPGAGLDRLRYGRIISALCRRARAQVTHLATWRIAAGRVAGQGTSCLEGGCGPPAPTRWQDRVPVGAAGKPLDAVDRRDVSAT